MKDGIFHFVRIHEAPLWERAGWIFVDDLGVTHGEWSVLMRWLCECSIPLPNKAGAA
jgi:hypothetical protein